MAVAFDNATVFTASNVSSASATHTPAGTPTAVGMATYWWPGSQAISADTYGGTTLGAATDTATDVTGDRASIYGLANPSSGAQTAAFTFAGNVFAACVALTVTGSDTTTCFSNHNNNSGSSNALSVVCTSATGELVMDIQGQDPAGTLSAGGSQTQKMNQAVSGLTGVSSIASGAASVTMSWSSTGSNPWASAVASFKAGGGGGGFTAKNRRTLGPRVGSRSYY